MSSILFDPRLAQARIYRAANDAFLTQQLFLRLLDRLDHVSRKFSNIAVIGHAPELLETLKNLQPDAALNQSGPFDLILDVGGIGVENNVPARLAHMRKNLTADGMYIASFFGGASLAELRTALIQAETDLIGRAAPRVHPAIGLNDAASLLQSAGFALPVADRDMLEISYKSLRSLVLDLRAAGLSNSLVAQTRTTPPSALFVAAEDFWRQHFPSPSGNLQANLEIITLTGWAQNQA